MFRNIDIRNMAPSRRVNDNRGLSLKRIIVPPENAIRPVLVFEKDEIEILGDSGIDEFRIEA
jgi:hypothetical protein